jgi:transposase InsO family protein
MAKRKRRNYTNEFIKKAVKLVTDQSYSMVEAARQPNDKQHEPQVSKDSEGNCWDNSVTGSFFGSLKTERVFDSKYPTREPARRNNVDCI